MSEVKFGRRPPEGRAFEAPAAPRRTFEAPTVSRRTVVLDPPDSLLQDSPRRPSSATAAAFSAPDDELEQWKLERRKNYRLPWRQLSWMAAACFGIAALVLPDWVNDEVQWLLYALMAMSAYVGFRQRRGQA